MGLGIATARRGQMDPSTVINPWAVDRLRAWPRGAR
jgi:hypothetical protein